jgi:hypothetical protein
MGTTSRVGTAEQISSAHQRILSAELRKLFGRVVPKVLTFDAGA